jgi:hypothetical protein
MTQPFLHSGAHVRGRFFRTLMTPLLAGLIVAGAAPARDATAKVDGIGVAAAVQPNASGQPPQQPIRQLVIGANVIHNERIRTSPGGRTQMVFVDGSALTIGPNADLVLDEFVYDPDTKTGKMAVTVAKGVFRLVGGKISKKNPIQFRTPTALIGIRGGIAVLEVGEGTKATFLFGEKMSVTSGTVTQDVTRPGFSVEAKEADAAPEAPKPITQAALKDTIQGFEGNAGETGGAEKPPTSEDVASSQISTLGSHQGPQQLTQLSSAGSPPPPQPIQLLEPNKLEGDTRLRQVSQKIAQEVIREQPNFGPFAGRYLAAKDNTFNLGVARGDANRYRGFTGAGFQNGRFRVVFPDGREINVPGTGSGTSASFSLATSPFGSASGNITVSDDGDFAIINLVESSRGNIRSTTFAGVPTPASKVPTSGTTNFVLRPDFVLNSTIPFIPRDKGGNIVSSLSSNNDHGGIIWDVSKSPSAVRAGGFAVVQVAGTGTSQSSALALVVGEVKLDAQGRPFYTGSMRGSSELNGGAGTYNFQAPISSIPAGNGSHMFGSNAPNYMALQSGTVDANGNATQAAATAFSGATASAYQSTSYATMAPSGNNTAHTRRTRNLNGFAAASIRLRNSDGTVISQFARTTANGDYTNISLNTSASTNTLSAVIDTATPGSLSSRRRVFFGDSGGSRGRSVFVDDEGFGAIESTQNADLEGTTATDTKVYLVSGRPDSTTLLPTGVQFCNCRDTPWGFWGGRMTAANGQFHDIHMGTFVAGDIPSASEIAAYSGTATYTGHFMGTVGAGTSPNIQTYLAVGKYQSSYNFASKTGSVTITSFDSVNYSGSINAVTNTEHKFSGSVSSLSGPTRNGIVRGAFMRANGNANGAMGGEIIISQTGGGYAAVGNFVAER